MERIDVRTTEMAKYGKVNAISTYIIDITMSFK